LDIESVHCPIHEKHKIKCPTNKNDLTVVVNPVQEPVNFILLLKQIMASRANVMQKALSRNT